MRDLPSFILGCTIAMYWCCVGAMIVRVGRHSRRPSRIIIPVQRRERLMWLVWVPLITLWIASPFVARAQDPLRRAWLALPTWAIDDFAVRNLRLFVALLGVVLLLLSIQCWRHMGRHWRMGIDPSNSTKLFMDGPFAYVRHPIYALSVALMICSGIVVPTPLMLVIVVAHVSLMNIKARNEEAFLEGIHGEPYHEYCSRTGRFVPRFRPAT